MNFPIHLQLKLDARIENGEFRKLRVYDNSAIDFFSNDYLGLAKNKTIIEENSTTKVERNGATGSRLISGNSHFYNEVENYLAAFYQTKSALLFPSGYLANVGLLAALPQKNDTILFDEYVHASIRDGIRLSFADSISFKHNDFIDLEQKIQTIKGNCFVVVESLYSMDGDFFDLEKLIFLCEKYNAYLIVDEAHSSGIYGKYGEGMVASQTHERIIARVHTFGKALGSHGAVVVGSEKLKEYLVNFCRPFIYSTGLSDYSLIHIKNAHQVIKNSHLEREKLQEIIAYFKLKITSSNYLSQFLDSFSPIQALMGEKSFLKEIETKLQQNNFLVKAIYSPSVKRDKERIRICLHSFNTKKEIDLLFNLLCELSVEN